LWITEADVVRLLSMSEALDAMTAGLVEEAANNALNMGKTHVAWPGGTLHALGAVFQRDGLIATKTWGHTEGGATPLLLIWSTADGQLLAIVEAFALGQLRTGSMTGAATRLMSAPDATRLAMIGAGKQALAQVAGVAAARGLRAVTVFSPTAANRERLAARLRDQMPSIEVTAAESLDQAVDGADIVTLATRATAPFLGVEQLARGVHVNAVGAITPERREVEVDVVRAAALVTVDEPGAVRRLSAEFRDAFGTDEAGWSNVMPISTLAAGAAVRPTNPRLTLFKAMGMGVADLALGRIVLEKARALNIGRPFEAPVRVAPRLF
jgi:ornithine cyclodeaminase